MLSRLLRGGIIDVPYSPHEANLGKLRTVRNKNGGIYITGPGNVPLSKKLSRVNLHLPRNGKLPDRIHFFLKSSKISNICNDCSI